MTAQTPVQGCTHHPGMGFVFVCTLCDNEPICIKCVTDRHNKHDLVVLTDFVSEQKQIIKRYVEELSKTHIPKLESEIKENDEHFKGSKQLISEMTNDIKRHGEQMKEEIDKITDRLLKLCRDLEKMNEDITEKNKTKLTKRLQEQLRPRLERCHQVLTSGINDDVITLARETRNRKCTSSVPIDLGTLKTATFKPGTIQTGRLERMLGKVIITGEDPVFRPIPKTIVISTFKPPFSYQICRTRRTGDEAWLSFCDKNPVYRVDQKGNVKEKIDCKVKVHSIAVSPTTGRVWFCVRDDKSIREITSDGNIVTRFNAESIPKSLCITQEDMVVVGMAWSGLSLYTTDGKMVTDGAGRVCRQEAVSPHHLAYSTFTEDVIVADSDNVSINDYMAGNKPGKQPRVIVMDKHLKLKFECRYIGGMEPQTGDSQQSRFYPMDVCFDGAGDVLVAEGVTKSVMLIDGSNGNFLRTVYICDGRLPLCISLQDDSSLWIRHNDDRMKIIEYRK
ncbi:uncharacterized protein [Argopecten irradians]|uniref:uncharacterized protein n=1 Tax=Argopecten irradians TaxID=31199 RepID=UPI00371C4FAD